MLKPATVIIVWLMLAVFSTPLAFSAGKSKNSSYVKHKKIQTVKKYADRKIATKRSSRAQKTKVSTHARSRHSTRIARAAIAPAYVAPTAGDLAGLQHTYDPLTLESNVALVMDQATSQILFDKNSNVALPIASITKLMTSLIVVESHQDLDEILTITEEDIDREKNSSSRLKVGSQLTRANLLHIALMSSENRAASALGRHYPGGSRAFVAAMNAKAKALGMRDTRYVDTTGLSSHNIASARDLAKLVAAAYRHPLLCYYSTDTKYIVDTGTQQLAYRSSNRLVESPEWDIGLQKTGYISEAGRCLVMQARIDGRPVIMVFLDAKGKAARLADVGRIRKWLTSKLS